MGSKKLYFITAISHLIAPIAMLLPVFRTQETVVGIGGESTEISAYVSVFEYLTESAYLLTSILMISLIIADLLGAINSVIALVDKKRQSIYSTLAFFFSFAPAIIGALVLYSRSYLIFIICAICFAINSAVSTKLMKTKTKKEQG